MMSEVIKVKDMALDTTGGYVAASNLQDLTDASLPVFNVERVQLQFSLSSDFVAAQVANNVLVLALSTGRILRIDLDSPADIDGGVACLLCADGLSTDRVCYHQISICQKSPPRLA